jgi:hypothetical protein
MSDLLNIPPVNLYKSPRMSEKEKIQAYDLYCKGWYFEDIGKQLGRHHKTIQQLAKREDWAEKRDRIRLKAMEKLDLTNVEWNVARQRQLEEGVQAVFRDLPNAVIKSREGALTSIVNATKEQRELRGISTQGATFILSFPGMVRPTKEELQLKGEESLPVIPADLGSSGNGN